MKFIKHVKLCLLSFSILTLSSCSSDWLETIPTANASADEVLESTDNIKQALNGISKLMSRQHGYYDQGFNGEGTIMLLYGEYMGEDFYFPMFAPGWAVMMNGQLTQQNTRIYTSYPWYYYYMLIGNANTILAYVDDALGDEDEAKFLKASALTFRAYSYYMLTQFYCNAWDNSNNGASDGVVLRLDASDDDMPLSTLGECYTQIYKDLNDAISLYKESGLSRSAVYGNSAVCYPDLNVAYAVYARAAITKKDYSTALTNAKLAQANRSLMSVADYKSGFITTNSEWIWGSYGDLSETMYYYSWQTTMAYNGYYGYAYYGTAASADLIDAIPSTDIRKSLFVHKDVFLGEGQVLADVCNTAQYGQFKTQAAFDKANAYAVANAEYFDPSTFVVNWPYTHLKFACTDMPGVGPVPFIRTSEMILLEAEANYFLGNTPDAQNNLIALNATSGRDPGYTCTATGTDLFNEIVLYRRLELWGEGRSWFDCKRWGRSVVRRGLTQGGNFHAAIAGEFGKTKDDAFWKWVIPARETDYNSAIEYTP